MLFVVEVGFGWNVKFVGWGVCVDRGCGGQLNRVGVNGSVVGWENVVNTT